MFIRTTLTTSLLFLSHAVLAQAPMLTVSPGGLQDASSISNACPTFSWGQATDANRYEVAVFNTSGNDSDDYQTHADAGEPVIKTNISAPALSWTPATNQCLDDGGSYLWFVRATTAEGESDWSEGRRFEVDVSEGVLAETVRQEVTSQLSQPDTWRRVVQAALQGEPYVARRLPGGLDMHTAKSPTDIVEASDLVSGGLERNVSTKAATFTNPSAFRINSSNGVVFDNPDGNLSGSGIPAEGRGTRFMWYPGKAALRAGRATNSGWDDGNIGFFSTAMGDGTTASGSSSTAMGYSTNASGDYSTAMGGASTASGKHSTAMGWGNTASGVFSIAMGSSTHASGYNSTTMGDSTNASGDSSTAMGDRTTASGKFSTAMGYRTIAKSGYETAIGMYNTDYTPFSTQSWNTADRLFVVGNGTNGTPTGRSDALVVLKNGNTGINVSNPRAPLHVDGGINCALGTVGGGGDIIVGNRSNRNVCIDRDQIMARTNGVMTALYLNHNAAFPAQGMVSVGGYLKVNRLTGSGSTDVCRNNGAFLSACSSSARYKEDIAPLSLGLDIIEQLEPVTFKWKDHEGQDLGFIAEEVAEIDPLLATYNEEGQIEGVKYKQLTAVLVNAIKTQQRQIEAQQVLVEQQQQRIVALEQAIAPR